MLTVADVKPLDEILAAVTLGAPLPHGALTVVPLWPPAGPSPTGSRSPRRAMPSPSRR